MKPFANDPVPLLRNGGPRAIIEATLQAEAVDAMLALVLATEGSTYVRAGAMAMFGRDGFQVGWLSGGCLEPEIAQRAAEAAGSGLLDWLDIDTRDDEDLFSGSSIGCRGRLHLALLPLAGVAGWEAVARAWLAGRGCLHIDIHSTGCITLSIDHLRLESALPARPCPWPAAAHALDIAAPPAVAIFGAGPETPWLLGLLRASGAWTILVERRPRWLAQAVFADVHHCDTPTQAAAMIGPVEVALVMHHHFELDREALEALAPATIPFIGLLGPRRRREDLFRVLPTHAVEALRPRLRSPVGLDLGGSGPEAIALSIAAQLQVWRHGR